MKKIISTIMVVWLLCPMIAVADNGGEVQKNKYSTFPYMPSIKWDKLDFEWNCKRYKDPGICKGYTTEAYGVNVAVVYSRNPIVENNSSDKSLFEEIGEVSGQKVVWVVGWPKELSVEKRILFRRTKFKYINDVIKCDIYVQISIQAEDDNKMKEILHKLKTNFNVVYSP